MPRIAGVDIPNDKKALYSLQYIHGIGHHRAIVILERAGVDQDRRAKDLSEDELSRIGVSLDKSGFEIEGVLRRQTAQNIARLKKIGCGRGFRHIRGLPVRGQRTRTNARTRKGRKKTVAGKKSVKAMR